MGHELENLCSPHEDDMSNPGLSAAAQEGAPWIQVRTSENDGWVGRLQRGIILKEEFPCLF